MSMLLQIEISHNFSLLSVFPYFLIKHYDYEDGIAARVLQHKPTMVTLQVEPFALKVIKST